MFPIAAQSDSYYNPFSEPVKKKLEEKVAPEQTASGSSSEQPMTLERGKPTKAELDAFCKSKRENSSEKPFTLNEYRRYLEAGLLPVHDFDIRHLNLDGATGEMLSAAGSPTVYFAIDWLNDENLATVLSHFPNLSTLHLGSQTLITDKGVEKIVELAPYLRVLTTYEHKKISDVGLAFLKRLPLECLCLGRAKRESQITDAGLRHLAEIRSLQEFTISDCRGITDVGVRNLCTLPLKRLSLSACRELTDASIDSIAQIATLEILNIGGNPSDYPMLTEAGIAKLKNHPKLQKIQVSWVPSIDKKAIARLQAQGIRITADWE